MKRVFLKCAYQRTGWDEHGITDGDTYVTSVEHLKDLRPTAVEIHVYECDDFEIFEYAKVLHEIGRAELVLHRTLRCHCYDLSDLDDGTGYEYEDRDPDQFF